MNTQTDTLREELLRNAVRYALENGVDVLICAPTATKQLFVVKPEANATRPEDLSVHIYERPEA